MAIGVELSIRIIFGCNYRLVSLMLLNFGELIVALSHRALEADKKCVIAEVSCRVLQVFVLSLRTGVCHGCTLLFARQMTGH